MNRPQRRLRYLVVAQPYSLDAGRIGAWTRKAYIVSRHRSLRAAGRVLGSMISGNLAASVKAETRKGEGMQLIAFDPASGKKYSREGCVTGVPLASSYEVRL